MPFDMPVWIVQGESVISGELREILARDPEVTVLRQVANDVLRVAMHPDRARRLASELPGLRVEPDSGLMP